MELIFKWKIWKNNSSTRKKAVNATANWIFFWMYSIHNPFVNLAELINTIYPDEWGMWEKAFKNSRKDSRRNKIYLKG